MVMYRREQAILDFVEREEHVIDTGLSSTLRFWQDQADGLRAEGTDEDDYFLCLSESQITSWQRVLNDFRNVMETE